MRKEIERIESFLVKLEKKNTIKVPKQIIDDLKLSEGDEFLLHFDERSNELLLMPLMLNKEGVVKADFIIPDEIGSLARVATVLAEHKINLLITTSKTILPGKEAIWETVIDISKGKEKLKSVIEDLKEKKLIIDVQLSY
jgi:predicted amino acid-binding ACT domain protein